MITPEEFEKEMSSIFADEYEKEENHINADKFMCKVLKQLGYEKGVKIFENADKYYI